MIKILKKFLHLVPISIIGLIPFDGVDKAQERLQYKIRAEISPSSEAFENKYILTTTPQNPHLSQLKELSPSIKCYNLSADLEIEAECKTPKYDTSSTKNFTNQLEKFFFPKINNHNEDVYIYGKLNRFRPTTIDQISHSTFESISENGVIFIINTLEQEPRWPSAFGALSDEELALNTYFSHIESLHYTKLPQYIVFLLCLVCIFIVGSLTYSYPIFLAVILSGTFYSFIIVFSLIAFEAYALQIPLFGTTLCIFLAYIVSISDQLNERRRQEYGITQEKESLEELETMRQNFLSLVSHDLKTPIAKIQALIEGLMKDKNIENAAKEKLSSIHAANTHLQKTISTMLLLNRVEAGQVKIHLEPSDLVNTLEESINLQNQYAKDEEISILSELEPLFLSPFDSALIREVADNIISNAIKYSQSPSKVVVRCGEEDNALELIPPQPSIWFEVQDFGHGIPPEDRSKVLEKFQRGRFEATVSGKSVQGSGLGLYLSKYFVEQHQGALIIISKLESEPLTEETKAYYKKNESGTVVRVVIPAEIETLTIP